LKILESTYRRAGHLHATGVTWQSPVAYGGDTISTPCGRNCRGAWSCTQGYPHIVDKKRGPWKL